MKFLINVLSNTRFTKEDLKQFGLNIRSQHSSNVILVFKKQFSLTPTLINYIKKIYPHVLVVDQYQDLKLSPSESYYWLNLKLTDCLLPNAVLQWEQIIQRHSSDVVQLTYLDNSHSLSEQVNGLIKGIGLNHPAYINTVKQMMNLPLNAPLFNLSLSQKLMMLLGLQSYKIRDTLKRYQSLNNFQLGFNFLIKCNNKMIKDLQNGLVSSLIRVILEEPEIIQINLPTIILSRLKLKERVRWVLQIITARKYIGDAHILHEYQQFGNSAVNHVKKLIFHSNLKVSEKKRLIDNVNQALKENVD